MHDLVLQLKVRDLHVIDYIFTKLRVYGYPLYDGLVHAGVALELFGNKTALIKV